MARAVTLFACVLLLAVWAYGPLRAADFAYEDRDPLASVDSSRPMMQHDPWQGWASEWPAFRLAPRVLSNLTMRAQGWAHASASGYHLGNVVIHLVNGALLFALLLPIDVVAALLATAVFLLHPLNSEAVSYISARTDLLFATGVLLMLLASERDGWPAMVGATLGGGLAVLAKESAVIVIGLLPLWLLVRGRWSWRWTLPLGVWCVGGAAVVYRLVHVSTAGTAQPWNAVGRYTSDAAHGVLGYAAVQAFALGRYLLLIVWPFGFSIDHDFDVVSTELVSAALVGLVAVIAWAWTTRCTHRWFAFAVAWVVVALGTRWLLPMPEYLHEQHLYVPLLGVWIALAFSVAGQSLPLHLQGVSHCG